VTWRSDDNEWCWLRPRENAPLAPILEEPPIDDGCRRANFDTQASDDHANRPPGHLARRRGGGGRVVHAVRSDERISVPLPRGAGYLYRGTPEQRFGRSEVISAIQAVGRAWDALRTKDDEAQAKNPSLVPRPVLQIIAIGTIGGGPLHKNHPPPGTDPFHKSHDLGVDVDISVVRSDGRPGRSTYKPKDSATYSRALTREAISLFLAQKVLRVKRVFYDDPNIDLDPTIVGPDSRTEHDNHFHVRFTPPPGEFP
jgi:hypothetical protein